MFRKEIILAILLAIIATPAIFAQGTVASISGTVSDATGGVIPGVDITVTNLDTGIVRSVVSNDQGRYLAPALASGNYEVKGELTGFQTTVRTGIVLSVAREAVVNLTLTVGSLAEQVTVTGEAALVDTRSQTMGGLVSTQQIADLPLNGRSMIGLTLFEGGVHENVNQSSANNSFVRGFGRVINVAGARGYMNSYLLDGTHSNDHAGYIPGSIAGVTLGVDAVQEFKMQTVNFGAEYGSAAGGVITAITKSGSNEFHGNIFEYHRNDNLDANDFISNRNGLDKPPFIRNQFGASIGGPIVKNSTFFFFNYEGLRNRLGRNGVAGVPNPEMKQGILPSNGTVNSIYGRDSVGNPKPDGLCHPSFPYDAATDRCVGTVDPRIVPYLDLWPTSNGDDLGDGTAQLLFDASEPTDENFYTGKVDHTINDTHSMFFRFLIDDANGVSGANGMTEGIIRSRQQSYTPELRSILSPNLVNVARVSYVRRHVSETNREIIPVDPALYFLPFTEQLGSFWIAGTGGVGTPIATPGSDARPRIINNGMWQFSDSVSYTRGNHSLKFGVDVKRWQVNLKSVSRWGGRYQLRGGDNDIEDFLLSNWERVDFTPEDGSDFIRGFRQTDTGLFIQDDWQVRPSLTLNLGLRYEFQTVPTEVNGKIANIRNPWTDTEHFIGDPWFENPSLGNFAPRIGIAWDPFGDGRTSIRTGFGMFYSLMNVFGAYSQPAVGQPPAVRIRIRDFQSPSPASCFPDPTCGNFYDSDFAKDNGLLNAWQFWDLNTPYMMKWNLDIQRELTPGLLASVGYVGSRGVHQWMDSQFQTCLPEFAPSVEGQPFFRQGCNSDRNPNFSGINLIRAIGGSQYHALMAKVNRRFANGVSFQASYTWSKSTDDDNGYRTPGARSNTALIWKGTEDDPKLWKGLSTHDVRANFTFNGSWALPGPQGGWAGAIAGGWQVNGILRVASGSPFTPVSIRNPTGGASGRQPGNLVGTDKNPIDPGNSLKYYDTSAFVNPTRITDPAVIPGCTAAARCDFLGNGGRNTVISSGYNTFDFSLFKQWSVPQMGEQGAIEFRSEFFNIFNRANFATPGITIGAGSAGRIDFLTSTARQIQFGLKVIF